MKNLPQVKKGDEVNVSYYESVALQLRKPGEATPGVTVAEEAERAKPGELPAGAVAEVATVTAKVVTVDRRKHTATLELPNQETVTVKVNDPARLDRVKVGDRSRPRIARPSPSPWIDQTRRERARPSVRDDHGSNRVTRARAIR